MKCTVSLSQMHIEYTINVTVLVWFGRLFLFILMNRLKIITTNVNIEQEIVLIGNTHINPNLVDSYRLEYFLMYSTLLVNIARIHEPSTMKLSITRWIWHLYKDKYNIFIALYNISMLHVYCQSYITCIYSPCVLFLVIKINWIICVFWSKGTISFVTDLNFVFWCSLYPDCIWKYLSKISDVTGFTS